MKKIFFSLVLSCFFSFSSAAGLSVYGSGDLSFMGHTADSGFVQLEKYGGGLGLEFSLFSLFSIGGELRYTQGWAKDPKPSNINRKDIKPKYEITRKNGVDFINVRYTEFWLRPKLMLPLPIISPYIVAPISLLGYGGLVKHGSYGIGFGGLLGVDLSLFSFRLFAESGLIARYTKGSDKNNEPPWKMIDLNVPITIGVGYWF